MRCIFITEVNNHSKYVQYCHFNLTIHALTSTNSQTQKIVQFSCLYIDQLQVINCIIISNWTCCIAYRAACMRHPAGSFQTQLFFSPLFLIWVKYDIILMIFKVYYCKAKVHPCYVHKHEYLRSLHSHTTHTSTECI